MSVVSEDKADATFDEPVLGLVVDEDDADADADPCVPIAGVVGSLGVEEDAVVVVPAEPPDPDDDDEPAVESQSTIPFAFFFGGIAAR